MEHSRTSHVLSSCLCSCVLSVRDVVWEISNPKRPCKARLEADDYFLRRGCVTNDERLTITSETQDPLLMLQNSDVWTTSCQVIKKFYTCFMVSFVRKKRVKKPIIPSNAKERWGIPSEDACKRALAHALEENCLGMQKLALCKFFDFSAFLTRLYSH